MLYDIKLRIAYDYDNAADASRQITCLMPLDLPGEQRLVACTQSVAPEPQEWLERTDFFGNRVVELAYTQPHRNIIFTVNARVERDVKAALQPGLLKLSSLSAEIDALRDLGPNAPHHFLGDSARVQLHPSTTQYARARASGDPPVFEIVRNIGQSLHADMRYDPEATTVETPMIEAFERRHGVCQDFSHVMIACLRGIGIPAGYVSGFLRTHVPEGKQRLEGADAMHAWVRAWCGRTEGWIEYDPTNAIFVNADHIVVARGRDYADVAPTKGILRTYGNHTSTQAVDVVEAPTITDPGT